MSPVDNVSDAPQHSSNHVMAVIRSRGKDERLSDLRLKFWQLLCRKVIGMVRRCSVWLAIAMLSILTCFSTIGCTSTERETVPIGAELGIAGEQSNSSPTPLRSYEKMTLTIVYDNNEYDERLETAWGFSCLVEGLEKTILFDTGGDSRMLLSNMRKLGYNPQDVEVIVISHIHYDHLGGLAGFLEKNHCLTVYLPKSLPKSIKKTVRDLGADLVEVHDPVKICENTYSTGELGTWIKEQSLVVETAKGLVVITGCAHPGIVNIVQKAKELLKDNVYLVLGGFHLCWMNAFQIKGIVNGVNKEGVEMVAPCHCSGDLARSAFQKVYGKNFIRVGVGRRLEIDTCQEK